MNLFISWSGVASQHLATYLDGWLRRLAIGVNPWVSSLDISAGQHWRTELRAALAGSAKGLFVLTSDTQSKPFVCFEAGALTAREIAVLPYLLDMTPAELAPVFGDLQSRTADRAGTWQLVQELHAQSAESSKLRADQLSDHFASLWPELERRLADLVVQHRQAAPSRTLEEVIQAIGELRQDMRKYTSGATTIWTGEAAGTTQIRYTGLLQWAGEELIHRYMWSMIEFLQLTEHVERSTVDTLAATTLQHVRRVLEEEPQRELVGEDLLVYAKARLESYFNMLHDTRKIDDETFQRAWYKIDAAHAPR